MKMGKRVGTRQRILAAGVALVGVLTVLQASVQAGVYSQDFNSPPNAGNYFNDSPYAYDSTLSLLSHASVEGGRLTLAGWYDVNGNPNTHGQAHIANLDGVDAVTSFEASFTVQTQPDGQNRIVFEMGDIALTNTGDNGANDPAAPTNSNHVLSFNLYSGGSGSYIAGESTATTYGGGTPNDASAHLIDVALSVTGLASIKVDGTLVNSVQTSFVPVAGDSYYIGGGNYGNGAFTKYVDNLVISSTTAPSVPEPASMSLLASGGLLLLRRRRTA